MYYDLILEMVRLVQLYEQESETEAPDVHSFGQWLNQYMVREGHQVLQEPEWDGKANGRSADSVINTTLVHLYRYAKLQAKHAIADTAFSTPDDFIYLITLVSFGSMTKTALIKRNVHEKSAGMQIIKRLLDGGLVTQTPIDTDKRNRMIHITEKGKQHLEENMSSIRQASRNVTEPLSDQEKMDLIRLLTKLETFHEGRLRGE
ncbi:MarR family winged helix-turn-helix transcriptional regulator [Pedobacter deserti]|uniref:MarR family winged helix-turn-helix transcriptional regulator n=1 Tax=Pedobacter deserti TaxID=2817382 RepID=UPI0021090F4B|nr:MarR family winged helix-turn-helix transcriptional regulator [Pedobacter sp. SYSU D00382]